MKAKVRRMRARATSTSRSVAETPSLPPFRASRRTWERMDAAAVTHARDQRSCCWQAVKGAAVPMTVALIAVRAALQRVLRNEGREFSLGDVAELTVMAADMAGVATRLEKFVERLPFA